ncbi:MAG TPA: hypothetical protein VFB79_07395 [Candidatus Angelobacter sp.]|nr:hypothetical protein [Candidatus Angelobacter sp.]
MNLAVLLSLLLWSIVPMTNFAQKKHIHRAKDMTLAGPNGTKAVFSDGILVPYAGDEVPLYKKVEIIREGKPPVLINIDIDGTRVMGDEAETRNGPTKDEDGTTHKDWSLGLWSCDGHYIILMTVSRWEDGTWNFRGSLQYAYDKTTGEYAEFKSPTSRLGNDTFVQWSPTKCDVAILRGDHGNEEAKPTQ